MKTHIFGTIALGAFLLAPTIGTAQTQGGSDGASRIQLRIADPICAALSPTTANQTNPNPSDINDNDLDDAEVAAIEEGCTLRAVVTDAQGRRLAGENLILTRAEAPAGSFLPFGRGRITNAQGQAVWRFQPTPNTDFIYQVTTGPTSTSGGSRSNTVEIQLCTGEGSVGFIENAPTIDAGLGCQNQDDENGDNDLSTGDSLEG
jgi:hypothetical protein